MDSGTIIISAIFIALVLLPFIFTGKKYRIHKKRMLKTLGGLAEQKQVKLSNYEVNGNFGIGMDQNSSYLFFARVVQDEVSVRSVLLDEMSRCKVKTAHRFLEDGEKIIDRVELALHPFSSAQPEVALEMYNTENDTLTIRGELQAAVKWEQIISGALKKTKRRDHKQVPPRQVALA